MGFSNIDFSYAKIFLLRKEVEFLQLFMLSIREKSVPNMVTTEGINVEN